MPGYSRIASAPAEWVMYRACLTSTGLWASRNHFTRISGELQQFGKGTPYGERQLLEYLSLPILYE